MRAGRGGGAAREGWALGPAAPPEPLPDGRCATAARTKAEVFLALRSDALIRMLAVARWRKVAGWQPGE